MLTKNQVEKEEYFQFEKEKQEIFNKFYKKNNWSYTRIYGKDNKYYDCMVLTNGKWIKVEEKFRRKSWPDLLVEIMQDTETKSPGWLGYTQADWLLYGMGERIYLVEIQKLREFAELYGDKFNKIISKKGWGRTENIAIPWSVILLNKIGKLIN